MEQLQKLIDEYVKWTQENRMAGKKIAVYLGLQVEQSPKHVAFYEADGEWAKTFAAGQPEHEQMGGGGAAAAVFRRGAFGREAECI